MTGVRFAIAGAGLIGQRHAAAIAQADGARVSAIVDPAPQAADFAAKLGVAHFPTLDALIAARACDGVYLCTPTALHSAGGMACIEAGLPSLVEKPLDSDTAAARRMVEAAEAAGVPLLTGHHRRHNPLIAAAKAEIEAGTLGRIVSAHAMFWLMKPDDYFDVEWRRKKGAGPILTNLAHDFDLMRHLVGEVRAVQAVTSNAIRGHEIEETCVLTFEFENGALGTANISDSIVAPWSWELTTGENPAYAPTQQACYQIGGTHGSLDLPSGRVWSHPAKRSWWEPLTARYSPRGNGDPLILQAEQFARVIRDGEAPLVSGREGLRTIELIEAVQRSAATGQRVVLGE
ncbi:Gfo/Idh/MocA family oxidoreductase [Thioclava sp. A2]|uniref:Gfo/Idh/MocA family protein n=1 Tax=Thioclava sp. FCG-A2 TaxID=3080562 RepID=UPI002955095A|nr:Gfo/Idh/MocA family oxidoreductase [Thioclava sp. A2]MDV7270934.1 Gfo/Idh/MocA family oxidoreductase [Thioclava sp. A2]